MAFTKATKQATFIKLAISGPSGSGKTYSALPVSYTHLTLPTTTRV